MPEFDPGREHPLGRPVNDCFRAALNHVLDEQGRGAKAALARAVDKTPSFLTDILKGRRAGVEDTRRRMAQALGLDYERMLVAGKLILDGRMAEAMAGLEQGGDSGAEAGDDFVLVPKVRARVSAGGGSLETDDGPVQYYSFRRDWLASRGPVSGMRLLSVSGDSMEPELKDNDLIMIDTNQTRIRSGKMYAVRIEDEIVVKVVATAPGALTLISHNRAQYPDLSVPLDQGANVAVIGRVVWTAREY